MKTIDLAETPLDLDTIIRIAREESVLLLLPDGKEFCIAEADDFEKEIEALRQSRSFQKFLEQRSKTNGKVSLEEVEQQITKEIAEKNAEKGIAHSAKRGEEGIAQSAKRIARKGWEPA
jgi:hypothetical protein